jgi:hypothetical protein
MISWPCPYCRATIEVPEADLGVGKACSQCGVPSHCPSDVYHKQRLRRLKALKATRALTASELREAAIHYRGLGQTDKADRAERAAELAARGDPVDHPIEISSPTDQPPPPPPPSVPLPRPAARASEEEPEVLNRPVGSEIGPLLTGLVLMISAVGTTAPLNRPLTQVFLVTAMASLVVAAGCGMRGGNCGNALVLSLLFTPLTGTVYTFVATTWERVTISDGARVGGGALAATGGLAWFGALMWAGGKGFFAGVFQGSP